MLRRALGAIGLGISLVALSFILVALGTGEWSVARTERVLTGDYMSLSIKPFGFGPFKHCQYDSAFCNDQWSFNTKDGSAVKQARLKVVKAFSVLSALFAGVATFVFLTTQLARSQELFAAILSLLSSIFGVIAMAVWMDIHGYFEDVVLASLYPNHTLHYGYSFGLMTASWALFFLCFILGIYTYYFVPLAPEEAEKVPSQPVSPASQQQQPQPQQQKSKPPNRMARSGSFYMGPISVDLNE